MSGAGAMSPVGKAGVNAMTIDWVDGVCPTWALKQNLKQKK